MFDIVEAIAIADMWLLMSLHRWAAAAEDATNNKSWGMFVPRTWLGLNEGRQGTFSTGNPVKLDEGHVVP